MYKMTMLLTLAVAAAQAAEPPKQPTIKPETQLKVSIAYLAVSSAKADAQPFAEAVEKAKQTLESAEKAGRPYFHIAQRAEEEARMEALNAQQDCGAGWDVIINLRTRKVDCAPPQGKTPGVQIAPAAPPADAPGDKPAGKEAGK